MVSVATGEDECGAASGHLLQWPLHAYDDGEDAASGRFLQSSDHQRGQQLQSVHPGGGGGGRDQLRCSGGLAIAEPPIPFAFR